MLFRSDRKSTRLNSSHTLISYAVFCLKKKNRQNATHKAGRTTDAASLAARTPDSLDPAPVVFASFLPARWLDCFLFSLFFFFNDTATPEIYPLSLHDPLPI